MVHKAAHGYFAKRQWQNYLDTLLPFGGIDETRKFDYQIPKLRDLPRVQAWRCKASATYLIDDTVNPLLFEGPAALEKIAELASEGQRSLEDHDAMLMDKLSAVLLDDVQTIFTDLGCIMSLPFESTDAAAVKSLLTQTSSDEPSNSALAKVRTALEVSPFWIDRAKQYLTNLPMILEMETVVRSLWQEARRDHKCDKGKSGLRSHFGPDRDGGHHGRGGVKSALSGADREATGSASELQDIKNLLQSASIMWPLDTEYSEWPDAVGLRAVIQSEIKKIGRTERSEEPSNLKSSTKFPGGRGHHIPAPTMAAARDGATSARRRRIASSVLGTVMSVRRLPWSWRRPSTTAPNVRSLKWWRGPE